MILLFYGVGVKPLVGMTKERTPICLEGRMHYEPFLPSPPMAHGG